MPDAPDAVGSIQDPLHAWISVCEQRPALTSALTRDFAALGAKSWTLHFQYAEDYRLLIQDLTDTKQLDTTGSVPMSSVRLLMLLGALNELLTYTVHRGIPLQDIADEAVAVATMMLGPPRQG